MSDLARILLVEDDPRDVELTLTALREGNLANEIDVASDGAQALDYLLRRGAYSGRKAQNPGVILLDLKLPKISGLEVLAEIRRSPQIKYIPVVALTSSAEERDVVKGYELGVNAYVVKPVDFEAFVTAVRQLGFFWAVLNQAPRSTSHGSQT